MRSKNGNSLPAAERKSDDAIYGMNHKRILKILELEQRWMTFDELFNAVRPGCEWTEFASYLEDLVSGGRVLYALPSGADVGVYRINQ